MRRVTTIHLPQRRGEPLFKVCRTLTRNAKHVFNIELFANRRYEDTRLLQIQSLLSRYETTPVHSNDRLTLCDVLVMIRRTKKSDTIKNLLYRASAVQLVKILKDSTVSDECKMLVRCFLQTKRSLSDIRKVNVSASDQEFYVTASAAMGTPIMSEVISNLQTSNVACSAHNSQFLVDLTKVLKHCAEKKGSRAPKSKKGQKATSNKQKKQKPQNMILPSLLYTNLADLYARLLYPEQYRSLPSQGAQQISRDVNEAMKSYYASKVNNPRANRPEYIEKKGFHCVTWKSSGSIKITKNNIELSLGRNALDIMKDAFRTFPAGGKYSPSFNDRAKTFEVRGTSESFFHKSDQGFSCKKLVFRYGYGRKRRWFSEALKTVKQIRLVPVDRKGDGFKLCITYLKKIREAPKKMERFMGIDLGKVNLAAMATNVPTLRPWIISGRNVVDINKKYNHLIATLVSQATATSRSQISHRIRNLWNRRQRVLKHMLGALASRIVDYAILHGIDKIIVGYNKGWKSRCSIGRAFNRNFQRIPFRVFINALFTNGTDRGVVIVENEESYTSKCDALATEEFEACKIRCKSSSNRRVKRGLYKSCFRGGTLINADINAAINIMRKHLHKSHEDCYDGFLVHIQRNFKDYLNPVKIQANVLMNVRLTKNSRAMMVDTRTIQLLCLGM